MKRIVISQREDRPWQGIPCIERTAAGRLWCTWFTGGPMEPHPDNVVVVTFSDNQGESWSPVQTFSSGTSTARAFDPCVWIDPTGRLWLLYNIGDPGEQRHEIVARVLDDPDAAKPLWRDPRTIELATPYAFRLNKPTALADGTWLMPVTHYPEPVPSKADGTWKDWFSFPLQRQGVARSIDQGKSWQLHADISTPPWALENMILARNDGSLWMLIRTDDGWLWESSSYDQGRTWSKGCRSNIASPGSRFHLRRLNDGRVMLINHMNYQDVKTSRRGRTNLSLALSNDDGKTWSEPLVIDNRDEAAYPDAIQDKDGSLYIVNDYARHKVGEIVLTVIKPEVLLKR